MDHKMTKFTMSCLALAYGTIVSAADTPRAAPIKSDALQKETSGGWKKFEGNPVMGGKYGTCFDGKQWLLWYNGRHGSLEQIGVVLHEGEDLGF